MFFKKRRLKKSIKRCMNNIEELERRRSRSQAALVDAILTRTDPHDDDVDYFNRFTDKINAERDRLRALQAELKRLENR